METAQLVLSQFKNIYNADNWELNKVSLYWKYFNNSVNWLNYVILILEVQFFLRHSVCVEMNRKKW